MSLRGGELSVPVQRRRLPSIRSHSGERIRPKLYLLYWPKIFVGVEREHEMFNTGLLQIAIRCHDDGSTMAALDVRGKQTGQSPLGDH